MPLRSRRTAIRQSIRLWRAMRRAARAGKHVALELFAGTGRVAKFWRCQHSLHAMALNVRRRNPRRRYNLNNKKIEAVIKKGIKQKIVRAVWAATPCSSFSLARRGSPGSPGGTSPLSWETYSGPSKGAGETNGQAKNLDRERPCFLDS